MKTLSAANTANIANRRTAPDILVRFTGMTFSDGSVAQWSVGDGSHGSGASLYYPGLISMTPIKIEVDMYGGLGHYGDLSMEFEVFAIKDLLQNDDLSNEPVQIVAKYGTDADIPLWLGVVDEWTYDAGIVSVSCVYDMGLKSKQLPIEQINAVNFTTEQIPSKHLGKWVPFTIGSPYRPLGYLIDIPGSPTPTEVIFNAAVSGHAAIGAVDADGSGRHFWCMTLTNHFVGNLNNAGTGSLTAGRLLPLLVGGYGNDIGLEDFVYPPFAEDKSGGWTNLANATDQDSTTYAELNNPAADGTDNGDIIKMRVPDHGYPPTWYATNTHFIGKTTKTNIVNHATGGARTLERFEWGFEIIEGETIQDTTNLAVQISSAVAFNNYDGADGFGSAISNTVYGDRIGRDTSAPGTAEHLPPANLGGLRMNILCWEEDLSDASDDVEVFRVYVAGFRLQMWASPEGLDFFGNIAGYDDDGSGTYTALANSLIETPCDVVYFILAEIWGLTGFDTASITAARTAYGTDIIAGQILNLQDGESILAEIASNSRMTLWRDAEGNWNIKAFALPGSNDKTFYQDAGDFVSDDVGFGEVSLSHSPLENIYNQFDILYEWNEAERKYNKTESVDESTAGAVGTWLTDSQAKYNITRKLTFEAKWIVVDEMADTLRNHFIYRYADRKRVVTFNVSWNGLDVEIGDIIALDHDDLDITASGGADAHSYEIFSITMDAMSGVITMQGIEADTSHSAL